MKTNQRPENFDHMPEWVRTAELCGMLGIIPPAIAHHRKRPDFPQHALRYTGHGLEYNWRELFAYLRTVDTFHRGSRPRWLAVVGHPDADREQSDQSRRYHARQDRLRSA